MGVLPALFSNHTGRAFPVRNGVVVVFRKVLGRRHHWPPFPRELEGEVTEEDYKKLTREIDDEATGSCSNTLVPLAVCTFIIILLLVLVRILGATTDISWVQYETKENCDGGARECTTNPTIAIVGVILLCVGMCCCFCSACAIAVNLHSAVETAGASGPMAGRLTQETGLATLTAATAVMDTTGKPLTHNGKPVWPPVGHYLLIKKTVPTQGAAARGPSPTEPPLAAPGATEDRAQEGRGTEERNDANAKKERLVAEGGPVVVVMGQPVVQMAATAPQEV